MPAENLQLPQVWIVEIAYCIDRFFLSVRSSLPPLLSVVTMFRMLGYAGSCIYNPPPGCAL